MKDPRRSIKGVIGPRQRSELHQLLDRVIDLRNSVEAGGRKFKTSQRGQAGGRRKITAPVADMYMLHQRALGLAATIIGESVLLHLQPGIDSTAVKTKDSVAGLVRYSMLLPANSETVAKHKLVGLMWQQAALIADPVKKRVKHAIGAEYGLSADAVSKWDKPCRLQLGSEYVSDALRLTEEISGEWYFAAVFGALHGPMLLPECVAAFHLAKKACGVSVTRGAPKKISS